MFDYVDVCYQTFQIAPPPTLLSDSRGTHDLFANMQKKTVEEIFESLILKFLANSSHSSAELSGPTFL